MRIDRADHIWWIQPASPESARAHLWGRSTCILSAMTGECLNYVRQATARVASLPASTSLSDLTWRYYHLDLSDSLRAPQPRPGRPGSRRKIKGFHLKNTY